MKECRSKPYFLSKKLSMLFICDSNIDTALSASLYYLNEFMETERTSVFIVQPWNQELMVYSSLDLKKDEISFPKSLGVYGWVFENHEPVIVDNVYEDSRFHSGIDKMTGFKTTNMICTPILDQNNQCLGTLQSFNKKAGPYTLEDLELMDLAAHMIAISIGSSERYKEVTNTNSFQKKFIDRFVSTANNSKPTNSFW
jgi:adenylate cyclase